MESIACLKGVKKRPVARAVRVVFILSGLVPVLALLGRPPDPMLLIYTCFVAGFLLRDRLAALADRLPGPLVVRLLMFFWAAGSLTELLAWGNNYLKAAPEPALFHPQLLADLILGLGFYGGWGVAWWLAGRWFRFTITEAFFVTGIQGIFFEQLGAVFVLIMRVFPDNPAQALLLGVYVFAVHGSAAGLALLPVLHRLGSSRGSRSVARFVVVIALMVVLGVVGTWMAGVLSFAFGGLPPKQSIIENPFW